MATPAYVDAGAAFSAAGDPCFGDIILDPLAPATVNAGDILVLVAFGKAVSTAFISASPTGFTSAANVDSGTAANLVVFYKVADGSEGGAAQSLTFATFGASPRGIARVYRFSGSGTGGYHAVGGTGTGSGTSITPPAVTTTLSNELAIVAVGIASNSTFGASTGESGGDWTEPVAESSSVGSSIGIQNAVMTSAGTITGGTITAGTTGAWRAASFALKEVLATTISPKPIVKLAAVGRAASW